MLERPDIQANEIFACLQAEYGIDAIRVEFLPLGADPNTAVYRLEARDGTAYFVKLRGGVFDETSVTLPKYLNNLGLQQVIAPLAGRNGTLWTSLKNFKVILYPFVAGKNGYEIGLTDQHWRELGTALKRLHTITLPPALGEHIQRETFNPQWRTSLMAFVERLAHETYTDPIATALAAFMNTKRREILALIQRAGELADRLQTRPPKFVLCHSDLHAGNIMVDPGGVLFIVDWDNPILAPKERDLMFIGGGQGFSGHTAQEEETFFYQGYGQTQINTAALAFYRQERIIEDMAIYCKQLLLSVEGGADREQSLRYFMSNFLPGGTLEMAQKPGS